MATPQFPSLTPRYVDVNWFQVDRPIDEEAQLTAMEKEHSSMMTEIAHRDNDVVPAHGQDFEEEEDDDDDNEDDDDDESNEEDDDEEIEVDELHFNPDSPIFA